MSDFGCFVQVIDFETSYICFLYFTLCIGTGNGTKSGLVKKVGGRCSGYSDGTEILYNLTLRLHVCSKADEYTERCPRCFDSACYSKGLLLFALISRPS